MDRLSNNSYDSGKLKPADAGSYGSSGSIDKRSRSGKENDLKEQKEVHKVKFTMFVLYV